ncbi:MAG: methionyl-tRNA formyltransferase [Desulfosoma sp.]|uniref:methionyl-tRNA formyltransferase n=1 Tax=Desulfosoma sp. TaxID=2603217 RepID=UPI00404B2D63
MRLIVIGQAPFGRDCLQALLDRGEEVVGAMTVPDVPEAKKPNPFKELAVECGLPLLQPRTLKGPEVADWVRDKKPDLFVLVFVTQYMGKDVIDVATHGAINYHPSLLPKYRGGTAIAWAILHGELQTGVTIHYIDDGVDTGDIVLQESVPIAPDDTTASLYFNKLYPLGVKLVPEAVRLIREGKAPRIPQDPRLASFQPALKPKHTAIDWRQGAETIHNLVRGAFPVPGARALWRGNSLTLLEAAPKPAKIWERPSHAPGEVLAVTADGFTVQTGLGELLVKRVQSKEAGKVSAADFAKATGLKAGDTFEPIGHGPSLSRG